MARTIYGGTSADYATAPGGRIVPGATYEAYDAKTGGSRITDLLDADGNPTTVVTASSTGLIYYSGPDGAEKIPHWLQPTAGGERTAVVPLDNVGETGLTPSLSIGTVTTGTAAATRTGTDEEPVLNLVLPSAGANGVNTAAIQDGAVTTDKIAVKAVTAAKLADDTITAAQIAANAVGASELADNAVTSAKIADGTIVNADISASAAIDGSKIVGLGNLLTANQASGGDTLGDTTGFSGSGATIAYVTGDASRGAGCIKVTASGVPSYLNLSDRTGIVAGQSYTFRFVARSTTSTATCQARIRWLTGAGASISTVESVGRALSTGWTEFVITGIAPANAEQARPISIFNVAAGTDALVDDLTFHRGTGGTWSMPGVPVTGLKPALTYAAATSDYIIGVTDAVTAVDTTSGAVTVTLPPAADNTGQALRIVKTGGANTLTITRAGSDTISPSSGSRTSVAFPAATHGEMMLVSSGTSWHVVSGQASDETVGRRLWKWEQALAGGSTSATVGWQLIYADTGWRDVSSLLLNGWTASIAPVMRRTLTRVELSFGYKLDGSAATSAKLLTLPAGFRRPVARTGNYFLHGVLLSGFVNAATPKLVPVGGVVSSPSGWAADDLIVNSLDAALTGALVWTTDDTWPASLPGTASGPIPTGV